MRYETQTKLAPGEVISRARDFFVTNYGLSERRTSATAVNFEGAGGGVLVVAMAGPDSKTTVELTSREWDFQTVEFRKKLAG